MHQQTTYHQHLYHYLPPLPSPAHTSQSIKHAEVSKYSVDHCCFQQFHTAAQTPAKSTNHARSRLPTPPSRILIHNAPLYMVNETTAVVLPSMHPTPDTASQTRQTNLACPQLPSHSRMPHNLCVLRTCCIKGAVQYFSNDNPTMSQAALNTADRHTESRTLPQSPNCNALRNPCLILCSASRRPHNAFSVNARQPTFSLSSLPTRRPSPALSQPHNSSQHTTSTRHSKTRKT